MNPGRKIAYNRFCDTPFRAVFIRIVMRHLYKVIQRAGGRIWWQGGQQHISGDSTFHWTGIALYNYGQPIAFCRAKNGSSWLNDRLRSNDAYSMELIRCVMQTRMLPFKGWSGSKQDRCQYYQNYSQNMYFANSCRRQWCRFVEGRYGKRSNKSTYVDAYQPVLFE